MASGSSSATSSTRRPRKSQVETSQAETAPADPAMAATISASSAELRSISGRVVVAIWVKLAPGRVAAVTSTAISGAMINSATSSDPQAQAGARRRRAAGRAGWAVGLVALRSILSRDYHGGGAPARGGARRRGRNAARPAAPWRRQGDRALAGGPALP